MTAGSVEREPLAVERSGAGRLITIPNILSISRLFFLPVILFFLFRGQPVPALTVMLISWSTDALDGYLARRLNQVSDLGRILDHLVDKIWVGSVFITLVFLKGLPLALAAAVIIRDLLILAGSSVIMKRRGSLLSSDVVGKITGCAFALLVVFYTLDLPGLARYRTIATSAVFVLIIVSFINYLTLYLRVMARFRLPGEEGR
ncbi:MAG: CDP-alcohol phosphatidyltransferase family protein [candidate division WOR-3 bacterium]